MATTLSSSLLSLAGSKVELLISCSNLADLDEFTKSDPICVLFVKQFGQWKEYGRTEAIQNSLNPKFVNSFEIEFEPSMAQQLMFSVYDIDSRSHDLKHHDFVGSVEENLLNLVDDMKLIKSTVKNLRVPSESKPRGLITITAEVIKDNRNKVHIHAGGNKLDKKGLFSLNKPDTYFEISRGIESVTYHPVYRTEIVLKSTNPRWRPFEISVQKLCNTDWDRNIQFAVYHFSGTDYHLVGRKITTLREMHNMPVTGNYREIFLSNPKREKSNKKNTIAGFLRFFQFRVDIQYSMLDFVRGGMQLNLVVAIDFTVSNGKIDEELSLHNVSDARENQYMDAIETLGGMISQYSIEQKIAVYGFGANWKGKEKVSNCFPLTKDRKDVYLKGVKAVLHRYEEVLPLLRFSGPTRLAPMIEKAAALAERENMSQQKQTYTVLLVITDGVVNDIDRTLKRLIVVSHLPLSVVFVGVGPADFSLMEQFHVGLNSPLKHSKSGLVADRSNTVFVAFRKENAASGGNLAHAREAMASISTQILQYMKKHNITPEKPKLLRKDMFSAPDPNEDTSENRPSLLSRNASRNSVLSVKSTGPACPTCGSSIEPGTQLYSEILNSSIS